MLQLKQLLRNPMHNTGLVLLFLSLGFYLLPELLPKEENDLFGFFLPNFAISIIYFFCLVINRKKIAPEDKIHNTIIFFVLSFISAWSLNRSIPIFDKSVAWLSVSMVLACINLIAFAYKRHLPSWAMHLLSFASGISMVLFSYLAIYLLPSSGFGLIGFFLLGLSLHVFVPLMMVIYSIILLRKSLDSKTHWRSFFAGIISVLFFVSCYIGLWNSARNQIDLALKKSKEKDRDLPGWVQVAQHVPSNYFEKRIMRADLSYSVPKLERNLFFDDMGWNGDGQERIHDPLVMMAVFFSGRPNLQREDQINLLQSKFVQPNQKIDRLWSGYDLYTEFVSTDVKIWSACNISYTEKTLKVTSTRDTQNWGGPQEAIYTFYMPEGAVVTSLSLWIDGKEEKAILTTKEKADSAYRTIVGVERRDPSIVHWQEGNTVSVKVFPIMAGNYRKFKIGVTAPLKRVEGKLQYDNIYFEGPPFNEAKENILFDFVQPVSDEQMPASFTSMSGQSYKKSGNYESNWNMMIKDPGLSDCSFGFDNKVYSLAPYHKKLMPIIMDIAYLDINKSWTRDEFNSVVELLDGKTIYVYDVTLLKLNRENKNELWSTLSKKEFSLFPLFAINDPTRSILISKSADDSPNLDDLAETGFMQKTKIYLEGANKIKLFNLGTSLSPYLKSLKEFRVFLYDKGSVSQLETLIQKRQFPDDIENDNAVIIHQSDMIIQAKEGVCNSSGPDHLMRLFAYNHIMQKLGTGMLTSRSPDLSLLDEAAKAYVVTPVSSLVVLESAADYKRFDIKDANVSLKNASLGSKGAVPEPHEWALIIISIFTLAFVMKRKGYQFKWNDRSA
jgi:XrtN system VIT domain protein